jgi:7-carboxy-7-deazaguanine synthase
MEVKTIIEARPDFKKDIPPGTNDFLEVAEFFCDTIQGEGVNTGVPATFLRMQHCTQNCVWCDTQEVWRYGNPYTFDELFELIEKYGVAGKLMEGQHLVLTGGSPLKQQSRLINFLHKFMEVFDFKPHIEIENECTLMPSKDMIELVDTWNNSPKLENSGNLRILRYQPEILRKLSSLTNSWFKFVISSEKEWKEIEDDFLEPELIAPEQIILMPVGADRKELEQNRESVVDMAIQNNVRYTTREHIVLWDKKTGV